MPPKIPVIGIGGLNRRGSGKLPAVLAVAQRLSGRGKVVHVVTDAPGADAPRRVDERADTVAGVGDRAQLMAAFSPTWIARDPMRAITMVQDEGAEVVVLDNGLPKGHVPVDLGILVEDAVRGFGNGRARPFGPLKLPLKRGLAQADRLITIGHDTAQDAFAGRWPVTLPRDRARLAPLQTGMDWDGMEVYAYAGIGVPERFFATLHHLGVTMVGKKALSDHEEMTPALLTRIIHEARALGAQIVTTEKDAVRLPLEVRQGILVLPVRLELEDWAPLDAQLASLTL